jgi:TfoX/Sxy family transcriptional regulator of competence genes
VDTVPAVAYDERLAERVRDALGGHAGVSERKMFGGIGFMIDGNMCCGVHGEELILRLGDEDAEAALADPHGRVFDMTGRPMKGWVLMGPGALESDEELRRWLEPAIDLASSLPAK